MPRANISYSDNFTFNRFGKWVILQYCDDKHNDTIFHCFVDKKSSTIDAPAPISESKVQLQHTSLFFSEYPEVSLLNSSLYYHYRVCSEMDNSEDVIVMLELYHFEGGIFHFVKSIQFSWCKEYSSGAKLLNEKYWYNSTRGKIALCSLESGKSFVLTYPNNLIRFLWTFVQQGVVLFIDGRYKSIVCCLAFEDNGDPVLSLNHPLVGIKCVAFDTTPGSSRVIYEEAVKLPEKVQPTFIRYNDLILQYKDHSRSRSWFVDSGIVLFTGKTIVTLNGKLHYHDVDERAFFPLTRHEFRAFFAIQRGSRIHCMETNLQKGFHGNYVAWNLLSNCCTLFFPSIDVGKDIFLSSVSCFYDLELRKWRQTCVLKKKEEFHLYLDGVFFSSKPRSVYDISDDVPLFNDKIFVEPLKDKDTVDLVVNGSYFTTVENNYDFSFVDNVVWANMNNTEMAVCFVNGAEIIEAYHTIFPNYFVCNNYCPIEALIIREHENSVKYMMLRYCDFEIEEYSVSELSFDEYAIDAVFLEQSIVFFGGKVYCLGSAGVERVIDIPGWSNDEYEFYSPEPGVLVRHLKYLDGFEVKLDIAKFGKNFLDFEIEHKSINIEEFLSDCSVKVFSAFGSYSPR
ncbi:hypothetical protein PCE1_001724 [Barthelona sp. PCE]